MAFKDFLKGVVDLSVEWAEKQQEEYAKYSDKYSRMGKEQLKREWDLHKNTIATKPMRKKAFLEACEANGISMN